eukprot:TRINITY_DN23139_c0_g1_i1.p1 TRINITY_DN23139_c0_g1~~TRINITY_DN23139_c0_g1_i1.p1  ORF type:complete len:536 (+),score=104.07 TRINITY_DN23139_c0_g1_i1:93-1700(+)
MSLTADEVRSIMREEMGSMQQALLKEFNDSLQKVQAAATRYTPRGSTPRNFSMKSMRTEGGSAKLWTAMSSKDSSSASYRKRPSESSSYKKLLAEEDEPPRQSVKELVLATDEGIVDAPKTLYQHFHDIVASHGFEMMSASAAILNAVWVGIQTDYTARYRTKHHPPIYNAIDSLFCWFFVTELSLKILAKGKGFFCKASEAKWNWFDTVVVGSQLLEVVFNSLVSSSGHHLDGSAFTVMRMLRMVRILRVARVASTFGELRKLVMSITASLVPLSWTLLLIFLMTYMFAIMITHVVTDRLMMAEKMGHELEDGAQLEEFFGTLPKAMTTLYMIISEGIHWGEVMHPLVEEVSMSFRPVICLYVAFQLFAMMNVITAYFVDAAMKTASEDERTEVADALLTAFANSAHLKHVDKDNMTITREDFYKYLDHAALEDFCDRLQIDPDDADLIFDLIDGDAQGTLNTQEFLKGVARLVGPASAEMTARISFEQRQYWASASEVQQQILDHLKRSNGAFPNGNTPSSFVGVHTPNRSVV